MTERPDAADRLQALFGHPLPLVGMVHLLPLPGAPRWGGSMEPVLERASADARALEAGGISGVLVENYGDAPFHPGPVPAETVAAMAVAVARVTAEVSIPVGVNVLRNDPGAALAVAAATGAAFLRVNVHTGTMFTDQGVIEGRAHETLRLRRTLGLETAILADVLVKHATPPPGLSPEAAARDAWSRGGADALVVSGPATGAPVDASELGRIRAAVPHAPLWLGSGLGPDAAGDLLTAADGAIVGSALQEDGSAGRPVEPGRVRRMVEAVERLRGARA